MADGAPKSIAGYSSADMVVTEEMMRQARAIAADAFKFKAFLEDTYTIQACKMTGIELEELFPKALEEFRIEANRARVVPVDVQKKRLTHFEAKRIWKIAAVMGERRARMDRAAETAEKLKVMDRTIVQSYGNVMKREATLLYKEQVQSERKQNALKKEHEMMQTKRLDFDEKLEVLAERHARMKSAVEYQQKQARETAAKRAAEVQAQIDEQRELDEARRAAHDEAVEEKRKQLQDFERKKAEEQSRIMEDSRRDAERRAVVLSRVKEQDTLFRTFAQQQLSKKADTTKSLADMRAAAIAERKEDRRLIFESKLENAERIKKLQQMRVAELAQKMEVTQRRLEHMKVVRKAVKEEKKHKKHAEIVDTDMLKKKLEQERPKSPGPGEYDVILTSQPKGGAWGATTVKSALELETERAAKLPGVGRYNIPSCIRTDKGVNWGEGVERGTLDILMDRAAKIPGPGEYDVRPKSTGVVVQIGETAPPSFLDLVTRKAAETPGPGAYIRSPVERRTKLSELELEMRQLAHGLGEQFVPAPIRNGKVVPHAVKQYFE